MIAHAFFNCPTTACSGGLNLIDEVTQLPIGGINGSIGLSPFDGDPASWQGLALGHDLELMIPAGVRKLTVDIGYTNSSIPSGYTRVPARTRGRSAKSNWL